MASKKKSRKTKKRQFKERPGYRRVPGRSRRYIDLSTGKTISRRQYIKRTEQVTSLESKAKNKKAIREKYGLRDPMKRYNKIVEEYKKAFGTDAKVRGNSKEAIEFRLNYDIFTRHTHTKAQRIAHIKAGAKLGIMTEAQAERYINE